MKYSDQQRIQKINDYAVKLLEYIDEHNITRERLIEDYSLQWLVTTPLYNIGEHAYFLSGEYKAVNVNITMLEKWKIIMYVFATLLQPASLSGTVHL